MLQYTILDMVKKPFVIYKETFNNKCCLYPSQGTNKKKAFLIYLPYSNIDILQNILDLFGLVHVRISYDINHIKDYRFLTDEDQIKFSRLYDIYTFPFNDTIKWLIEGQYVYNFPKYNETMYNLLRESDIMVYLFKRNLRDIVIFHAKQKLHYLHYNEKELMMYYIKMPYYYELLENIKLLMPWFTNETFEEISFETLSGIKTEHQQFQIILKLLEDFNIGKLQTNDVIKSCINNIVPFDWQVYWNNEIEKWFIESGFQQLNKMLQYE